MSEQNNEAVNRKIRLSPPRIEIGYKDGFTSENDLFDFSKFGQTLANVFLDSLGLRVCLLDDVWGSGKTTFVKQWAGLMRERGAQVVYIDAFENDYQSDPFEVLVSEINVGLDSDAGADDFVKAGVKALVAMITKKSISTYTGGIIDVDELTSHFETTLKQTDIEKAALADFKTALSELVKKRQIVVIVDELDRCRPDFALRLLERVKHLFDVDGVTFLIACGQTELVQMVQHAYGFDSQRAIKYLDKFMDIKVNLPRRHLTNDSRQNRYIKYLIEHALSENRLTGSGIGKVLSEMAEESKMELRDLEKVLLNFNLVSLGRNFSESLGNSLLAICIIKAFIPDLYAELQQEGSCSWEKLKDVLCIRDINTYTGLEISNTYFLVFLVALFADDDTLKWATENWGHPLLGHALKDDMPFGGDSSAHLSRREYVARFLEAIEEVHSFATESA